jgi:hypothetical protein
MPKPAEPTKENDFWLISTAFTLGLVIKKKNARNVGEKW